MSRTIVKCPKCGHPAVKYNHGISCVYCKNGKLDLKVSTQIPKGKIKSNPLTLEQSEKLPLFSKNLAEKQTSLF